MKKLYLSKHKNGYYYIYYNDDNGKRQSVTALIIYVIGIAEYHFIPKLPQWGKIVDTIM